jgi:hypothetical protein
MSNATPHSHNPGDNKRRRSRGGQNRRNNNQQDNRGQDRDSNSNRDRRGQSQYRNPNAPNQPSNTPPRKYAPAKLSWWQKLLRLIGLYKTPVRQAPRPARTPDSPSPAVDPKVKSNTRNVRTGDGEAVATDNRRDTERSRERGNNARSTERSRGGDRNSVESPRVYVGNLSYDVTESDLQDLFKGIGGVRNVEVVYNRSTHRSKGFGFVEMLHMDEAKRAVEVLHDQPFMGRKLTVSGAQSKGQDEREDKDEREERQERRPRPVPLVAAAAPAPSAEAAPVVTAASLDATAEITTIIEQPISPESAVEVVTEATEPAAAVQAMTEATEPAAAVEVVTEATEPAAAVETIAADNSAAEPKPELV